MFYEGSNASASGYGATYVRNRQIAAQPQTVQQETEYKLK
ncbi:hypothetical protein EC12741_A0271 [Escherichia coli 1.2741]|nr:hypothetical protein EC12741_A0271 [Escherichia coli 1.2741]